MHMPRPDEASKEFFQELVPDDPRVTVRPMFGNVAGFVNGNMFIGLHGNDFFVRLSEDDRTGLLAEEGAASLEPMPGRPMKEYVNVPRSWWDEPDRVRGWIARSLEFAGTLPEKKPRKKKQK